MSEHVIIVGGGELTVPAFREAKEIGLKTICFDFDPDAPGMKIADVAVDISTKDPDECVRSAKLLDEHLRIVGVFTCGADVEVTVASIADALHLHGIPIEVAKRCNDKYLMHQHLESIGFTAKPRMQVLSGVMGGIVFGWPRVVKPHNNCASRGVSWCWDADGQAKAIRLAQEYSDVVLIEEALIGSKHTCEMIAYDNKWHLVDIIDTHYRSEKYPCESGLNTTQLSKEMQQKVFEFSILVAKAVGVRWGAHKVDVNVSPGGEIKVIELTARLSGGYHCQWATPRSSGKNSIRAALELAVGKPLDRSLIEPKFSDGAAIRCYFPPPGRVKRIDTSVAEKCLGVEMVKVTCGIGDMVGPYLNSADRVCYVMVAADTTESAIRFAEYAAGQVEIETLPECPKCGRDMKETRESRDEPCSRGCCNEEFDWYPKMPVELFDRY